MKNQTIKSVITHRIDPQIGAIVAGIQLPAEWRTSIMQMATTGSNLDLSALKQQRQRLARAYGDGAYNDEDYQRRLDEIDAKIRSATPASLPSIEEAAQLIDDLPLLWQDAQPEERRKLVAPLVDHVYLDLRNKKITAIKPKPGFKDLLTHSLKRMKPAPCILLSPEEVREMQNVGMVETGEGQSIPYYISDRAFPSYGVGARGDASASRVRVFGIWVPLTFPASSCHHGGLPGTLGAFIQGSH
jgi:hypothetical protein